MIELDVLVPVGDRAHIDPRSGIVGDPILRDGRRVVYYEGNRHGASNLFEFVDRVNCAAGRLVKRYPTVAFGAFPADAFLKVGTYTVSNDFQQRELRVTDQASLDAWLA